MTTLVKQIVVLEMTVDLEKSEAPENLPWSEVGAGERAAGLYAVEVLAAGKLMPVRKDTGA